MKKIVVFYSFTGTTKVIAEDLASKENADLLCIRDLQRPGMITAYLKGCYYAIRGKSWPIEPLTFDLEAYDSIYVLSPVWAGKPAPAVNAFLERLPSGKDVYLKMISKSGNSNCKSLIGKVIAIKGSELRSFEDIKV